MVEEAAGADLLAIWEHRTGRHLVGRSTPAGELVFEGLPAGRYLVGTRRDIMSAWGLAVHQWDAFVSGLTGLRLVNLRSGESRRVALSNGGAESICDRRDFVPNAVRYADACGSRTPIAPRLEPDASGDTSLIRG